jgi:TRAP-type uncharacterized transport system substrate-binding protein
MMGSGVRARAIVAALSFVTIEMLGVAVAPSAMAQVRLESSATHVRHVEEGYGQKKREANDIALSLVVSGLSCTCARFAEDIRNVVNDLRPDGLRVLPVLGVGGLQNLKDVLYLKGIDLGVVDEDNLRLLKARDPRSYGDIEQRVRYIAKLYNSEFHVLARDEIRSFRDLQGKTVNFNLKDSQTEVTAQIIFDALGIQVNRTNYDNDEAIKKLRDGELAAMIVLTGAPQAALAKLKREDRVHFLPLDRSASTRDLHQIFESYLPGELTHAQYPELIPEGTSIPTVANRALLVAYAWPEGSTRYKRLAKFVDQLFTNIDQFADGARHPKWKEASLTAEIPGWTRFKPAAEWLAAHSSASAQGPGRELNITFEQFVSLYSESRGQRKVSQQERDMLYAKFQNMLTRGAEQSSR